MKQKLQIALAAMVTLGCGAPAFAREFVCQGLNFNVKSLEEKTASVGRNSVVAGEITIPEIVIFENDGSSVELTVTSIDESAFDGNMTITSVRIPDTVTEIGNNAFDYCDRLESVDFGSSVITIGDYAFRYCSSLKAVELPASVESVGKFGFGYCDNIEYAMLGEKLTVISYAMFANNFNLKHVDIPSTVTEIAVSAFSDCHSLEELILPEGLAAIKISAIYRCKALKQIVIPSTVKSIGMSNFWYCENLRTVMSLTEEPLVLDSGNFSHTPVETLIVPEGLKKVYAETEVWNRFENIIEVLKPVDMVDGIAYTAAEDGMVEVSYISAGCGENVSVPAEVTVGDKEYRVKGIGLNAAILDSDIHTLSIGEGCDGNETFRIGEMAFANCPEISLISVGYANPPAASDNVFAASVYDKAEVTVPDAILYSKADSCWNLFKYDTITGMDMMGEDTDNAEFYTLSGLRVRKESVGTGLYIRRTPDGSSRVLIR